MLRALLRFWTSIHWPNTFMGRWKETVPKILANDASPADAGKERPRPTASTQAESRRQDAMRFMMMPCRLKVVQEGTSVLLSFKLPDGSHRRTVFFIQRSDMGGKLAIGHFPLFSGAEFFGDGA